jgi:hypothetical protein
MLKKIADFEKSHRKIVHHDEFFYRLKLMYLFLLHVVYIYLQKYLCIYLFNFISVIYRTQITDKNQTNQICQIMSPVGERSKRHAPAKQQKERSECKAGKLGPPHCDVSCETVLGPKYKFCEEHRICENTKCTCAWGYTGLRCNTR